MSGAASRRAGACQWRPATTSATWAGQAVRSEEPGCLEPVGHPVRGVDRVDGGPAQGLDLPALRAVADPRQPGELGVAPEHQIGEGAAGEVRGRHAGADVAARPAETAGSVVDDGRGPVSRHSEHAGPGVGDRDGSGIREESACGLRKEAVQQRRERPDRALLGRAVGVDARPVAVRHAPPAEGDAVVGGALRVHVDVCEVAEGLAAVPADGLPERRRQRLGHDHRRVHRQPGAVLAAEVGREALGRPQHVRRPDRAPVGDRPARRDLAHLRLLVDRHAEPLDRLGESAHELARVNARAMRVPGGAERAGDADTGCRGRGIHHLHIGMRPRLLGCRARPQARELRGRAGDAELAALDDVGVDALAGGDGDDLVDRLVEGALLGDRGVATVGLGVALTPAGHGVREPPAVATGCPEAGEPLLEHDHPQGRLGALEVVRGPEAGVAGARRSRHRRRGRRAAAVSGSAGRRGRATTTTRHRWGSVRRGRDGGHAAHPRAPSPGARRPGAVAIGSPLGPTCTGCPDVLARACAFWMRSERGRRHLEQGQAARARSAAHSSARVANDDRSRPSTRSMVARRVRTVWR